MAGSSTKQARGIEVTIDGAAYEVRAEEGRTLIEVCDELGIEIPRFCYHPLLSVPANCRMCLVEVEGAPKLLPACHTPIKDGMVVSTNNERVRRAREAVLELLLVNHPVDCPICDRAGECPLQDQYYEHDLRPSVAGPPEWKVKKGKAIRVGPRVTLDQERCVLCTRCTRFMDEIANDPQLGMFWRSDHAYISTAPGASFDSNYSLNTVSICPVGALTSTDFRFEKRVWELRSTPSLCDGCSRGCNCWIDLDGARVYRRRPRENPEVNDTWLCDHGFLSYRHLNESRILTARLGRGGPPSVGASLDAAWQVASMMRSLSGEGSKIGFLVSACLSVEDAFMAAWFASEIMKRGVIHIGGREEGEGDEILLRRDRNPNRLGVLLAARSFGLEVRPFEELLEAVDEGGVTTVYSVGEEVPADEGLVSGVFSSLEYFVLQASTYGPMAEVADVVLPAASRAEYDGTFVNAFGRLQRFFRAGEPRGEAAPHWDWLAEVARQMGEGTSYRNAGEVFDALSGRSDVFRGLDLSCVGEEGMPLDGVGDEDDQSRGRAVGSERGVSRWPR